MAFHKTRSEIERKRLELAEFTRQMRERFTQDGLPDPAPEPPACERHPNWRPSRRFLGSPRPPAHMCPYCKREAQEEEVGPVVWIRHSGTVEGPGLTRREQLAVASYHERLERAGIVVPGSEREREVLEDITELREREKERDRPTSLGRLVAGRIEGGSYVEYRNVAPFGKAPRIVRVAP